MSTLLTQLSDALAARLPAAQPFVAAVRNEHGRHITALRWNDETIVTSEQAMGSRESYEVATPETSRKAVIAGRDNGTNLLVLRLEQPLPTPALNATRATVGALVTAFGATDDGRVTTRLGVVNSVGPEWHSQVGGRIEERITLDIRLGRTEEGGPVFDAAGGFLGMSTLGPRGQVLVIPAATLTRVVPQLLKEGRVPRGWLGLGLQPVEVPEALRAAAGHASGMMVMSIVEGGPGARGGVTAGDIALSVDDAPIGHWRGLAAKLGTESIGRELPLRVIRGGEILTLNLPITARPQP
jgi:S1-C subfamily serine protease